VGGLASALASCAPAAAQSDRSHDRVALSGASPSDEVEIALQAVATETEILPGQATRTWTYRGELLSGGDASTVVPIPGSYLGPILCLRRGQRVRVRFTNQLDEPTIVHWHGLHVPEAADGHPRLAIGPGETYQYEYTLDNRAGTYWYHPHPHGRTGPQVLRGLAGLLLVTDEEEGALGLPTIGSPGGEYDVPLVLQDRTFDRDNQFVYLSNRMEQMMGYLGERILVNGQPDYVLQAAPRAYRLRLLNGSNSRTYKLAWHDGTPLTVIATDGGLLERPVQRAYVMLSPGERVELWADFAGREGGDELRLQSLPFFGGEVGGMMGGSMGRMMASEGVLPNGSEFTVLRVRVAGQAGESPALPKHLSEPRFHRVQDAVNRDRPRTFEIAMQHMRWFLNGRTFEMEAVAKDEIVRLGDLEVWEFVNQRGMMGMIHPMHIHNVQFQVIERQMLPQFNDIWDTVQAGYVDEGWKDTVLVMPGERVKVLLKFEDYEGLYLYHCHNLEHEDQGMMRNYRVKA
jgi:FtsP/CotA-like multicopper oxidase with cupredoxin domain